MNPSQFLHTHRIFTREEMAAALGVPEERSPATLDSHLARWGGSGRVRRLRKGLYVRVDPTDVEHSPSVDPFSLAGRMAPDAVLAFHTALELHGYAQSSYQRLYFCTWTKVRALRHERTTFVPVRPRAGYAAAPLEGVETLDRLDGDVRVTTRERTLLDVLDRPELGGGIEEIWRSVQAFEVLDLRELEQLLQRIQRPVLVARLGFLLETMHDRWLVPETLLERLTRSRPRGPVALDRRRRGTLISRWNLVVPVDWTRGPAGTVADDAI